MSIGSVRTAAALSSLLAIAPVFAATPARLPLPQGCEIARRAAGADTARSAVLPVFPPIQLEIRTPFEPTAFSGDGYSYLIYELHLQNYSEDPLRLKGIEVLDASGSSSEPLLTLTGPKLYEKLLAVGPGGLDGDHPLDGGRSGVALICLAFDESSAVPARLSHRVLLDGAAADGPAIGTRHDKVKTLGRPVAGPDWIADNGLRIDRHHRPGLFVVGGLARISRRYAIDWKQRKDDALFSGDARDVRSYHAYGKPVLAVADATVVLAQDGIPDNIPRTEAGFNTAVPLTMQTVSGNAVVLDIGDGQFAYYAHLKPGSVQVKKGDRVRRGAPLAQIGNSGDARWPHLHFQVVTSPDILASEGVPYVIDRYRMRDSDGNWQTRTGEFPLDSDAIDFGADDRAAPPKP
ncbi:M23 family metallopeptidase [Lysobacter sp. CA199]|uniref:M23 family metallopeptidase n=1 Tax=Lysobacter sp. CA199 TaxID=3455608 RepID=UPI003F8D213D